MPTPPTNEEFEIANIIFTSDSKEVKEKILKISKKTEAKKTIKKLTKDLFRDIKTLEKAVMHANNCLKELDK